MNAEEQRARMESGCLYLPGEEGIMKEQTACLELLYDFNAIRPLETAEKSPALMKKMFAEVGEDCYIERPLYASWGGKHVHLGKSIYINFHMTFVDDGEIFIDDYCMFGPNVTIVTAGHTVEPTLRREVYQYNLPVHIQENVWVGAGVIILPGVTIGANSVIGAGSIVTKDIPANVVAVGNPCRVLRAINERDREFYYKDRRIDL